MALTFNVDTEDYLLFLAVRIRSLWAVGAGGFEMRPISLSTDAYSTVRALRYAGRWKLKFIVPVVQRELTSLGLASVDDDWLVITAAGMAVPRIHEPTSIMHPSHVYGLSRANNACVGTGRDLPIPNSALNSRSTIFAA
jgi:hypothetical protein